jgi:divalent metal cation (Fe/Co/Zn/Cd) transporter
MYLRPESVLPALDIEFDKLLSASEVTSTIDRIESAIRSRDPNVRRIFIEAESTRMKTPLL